MKVKIFTEGGKRIGLGHVSRCISLYEEVSKRKILVDLIINGDVNNVELLSGFSFINENWLSKDFITNNITSNDYVIIDSYLAEKELYELVVNLSRRVICIDDFARIEYPKGILVNPSLDSSHIDYSNCSNQILLSGPDYVILRQAFRNAKRKDLLQESKRILIIMGGTDIRRLIPLIANSICKDMPNMEFDIVIGTNFTEEIQELAKKIKNISFYNNINSKQMVFLMRKADFAITAAGQTIYELLAINTPFIPIQVIENQENNIKSLLKYNPEQIILKYDDINFLTKLKKNIEEYSNFENREIFNKKYEGLVDGYGAERIIDVLLKDKNEEHNLKLRKAKKKDIKEVYNLSNQDYVRRYSINKEKIRWKNHVKWFNSVIEDENTVFYIATDENELFLGQIRYNIIRNSAIVSISLSEKLMGKGLSKNILKSSINKLFEEKYNVDYIIAYVSNDNVSSIKLFEGLNFINHQDEEFMLKFILKKGDFYAN